MQLRTFHMGRICWGIGELIGDGVRVSVVFNGRATTRAMRHNGCADFDRERVLGVGLIETEGLFGGRWWWESRLRMMRFDGDFEVGTDGRVKDRLIHMQLILPYTII